MNIISKPKHKKVNLVSQEKIEKYGLFSFFKNDNREHQESIHLEYDTEEIKRLLNERD